MSAPMTVWAGRSSGPRVVDIINLCESAEALLAGRVQAMRARGLDNRIVCMPGPRVEALRAEGIPVHTVPLARGIAPLRNLLATIEIARYLRREQVDIVHTHCSVPGVVGRVAARLAGVPLIIHTVHGFHLREGMPRPLRTLYLAIERFCGRFTDVLLTQSREDLERARRHRIGPPGRRLLIGNGIDLQRYRPRPIRRTKGEPVTITCVARLEPVKNHRMLFEAVTILRRRRVDFRVWIVGDGPLRRRYERLCRYLGIDDVVEFRGHRDDIPEVLADSDILVLTSLKEGVPRAVLEAMAMGIPVVATRVSGTREVVRHLETGLTVALGDSDGLASALDTLVRDPIERARLGTRAWSLAVERFDERAVIDRLHAVYRNHLKDRARPARPERRPLPLPPYELRRRAWAGKELDPRWSRAHRRLSFPLTLALLRRGVTADQVSIAMMAVGAAGAALLAAPWLAVNGLGFALLYVAFLLDKVDGAIARCQGHPTTRGVLLDRMHHRLVEPAVFAAVAWHAYGMTGSVGAVVAGLVSIALANVVEEHQQIAPYIAVKHVRSGGALPEAPAAVPGRGWRRAAMALRPLEAFRTWATSIPMLAVCYAAEAVTGRPFTAGYLLASAMALAIVLVFQCARHLSGQLDVEIHSATRTLGRREAPTRWPVVTRST
jgi:glycosyltransferase involved in cell wall biosynthesis/phosphatidylglycerophosphate synthase